MRTQNLKTLEQARERAIVYFSLHSLVSAAQRRFSLKFKHGHREDGEGCVPSRVRQGLRRSSEEIRQGTSLLTVIGYLKTIFFWFRLVKKAHKFNSFYVNRAYSYEFCSHLVLKTIISYVYSIFWCVEFTCLLCIYLIVLYCIVFGVEIV